MFQNPAIFYMSCTPSYKFYLGAVNIERRKILKGQTTFRFWFTCRNFRRGGYQVEKEKTKNCLSSPVEHPAAATFVLFCS